MENINAKIVKEKFIYLKSEENESENEKKLIFCIKYSYTCNSINSSGIRVDMNLIIDAKQEMSNIATNIKVINLD